MFGSTTNTNTNNNNWGSATSFGRSSSFSGTGSGSLFGNSNSVQPKTSGISALTTGGGLFGNSTGNNNLFGSTAPNNNSVNNSSSSGLFGNSSTTNNSTSTGTGMFSTPPSSNSTSTGTGLFGGSNNNNNASTGTGLFGNSSKTNNPGSGLFGNSTNNPASGGSSLFGNSSTNNTSGGTGLFNNSSTNNTSASTGLFGNSASNNTSSGTGLFGNASSSGSGLFGNSSTNNTSAGAGIFGNSSNPTSGGLFGGTNFSLGNNTLQNSTQSVTNNPYGQSQEFASVKYDINTMPKSITEKMLKDSRISDVSDKKRRCSYLDNNVRNKKEGKHQKSSLLSKLGRTFRFFRNSATESITKGLFTPSNFLGSGDKLNVLPKSQNLAPKRISKQPYKSKIVSRDISSIKRLVIKSKPLKYHMIDADKVFNSKKRKIMSGIVLSDKLLQDQYSSDESDDEDILQKTDMKLGARFAYKTPDEKKDLLEMKNVKLLGKDDLQRQEENINDPDNKESNNGYWCNPPIKELSKLSDEQLTNIENFIVGRVGYGQVAYNFPVDLSRIAILARKKNITLNKELFENIIKIHHKNIQVYAEEESKPPIGFGLNIPATITLEGIKPKDDVSAGDYIKYLQSQIGMQFVTYDPITCIWVFKVRHFSIWGLLDEEDQENKKLIDLKRKQDEKEEEATLEYSKIYENPEVSQELKKLKLSYDTDGIPGTWKYNSLSKDNPLNIKRGLLKNEINSQITKYKDHRTAVELSANVSDITIESSSSSDNEIEQDQAERAFEDKRFDYLKQFVSVLPRDVNFDEIVNEKAYEPEISNETAFDNIKIKSNFPVSDDWLIQLELSNDINSSLNPLVKELPANNNVTIEKVDEILFSDFNKSIAENQMVIDDHNAAKAEENDDDIKDESLNNFTNVVFKLISKSNIKLRDNNYPKVLKKSSPSFSDIMTYADVSIEEKQFLELGSALFDAFDISDEYDDVEKSKSNLIDHLKDLQQKKKIKKWLKIFNKPTISDLLKKYEDDKMETIFILICAGDLKQAILSAINSNNLHLASMITLLDSNDEAVKVIASNQLTSWEDSDIIEKIPRVVIKIHQILAGRIEAASENLSWNITLAIRLFYGDMNLELFEILDKYFDEIQEKSPVLDILKSYRLFKKSGATEALKSISVANLSLKLKWYFNKVLNDSDEIDESLSASFGKSLQKHGMWSEAIFIYAHIETDSVSQSLIRNAVIENVDKLDIKSDIGDEEEFLNTVLKVPKELIFEARSMNYAKKGNYWEECEALINAKLWERSCMTIVNELGPICVISNNSVLKGRLLSLISKFPDEGRIIPDWNQTTNIYYKYIQISENTEDPDLSTLDFLLTNIPLVKDGKSFQSRTALKIISKKVGEMAIEHAKELLVTKEKILSLKLGENELAYFSIRLQSIV